MDGQSERVIQVLEDMLRSCVIDYGSWDKHIPLVEFVYNNSFQLSLEWRLMRLFMEGSVELHYVGQS